MKPFPCHHFFIPSDASLTDWLTAIGTVGAVIVALGINWWNTWPKKSRLKFVKESIINQDTASTEEEKNLNRLLHVGRVVIKNKGKYKAASAEAYLEDVIFEGKSREGFIPMPLVWTHGQLNEVGPTVRDIYPNQTVYLDIFNHSYDNGYKDDNIVYFAVATGMHLDTLSQMNIGESELIIKIYQESGQVNKLKLKCNYSGSNIPSISII